MENVSAKTMVKRIAKLWNGERKSILLVGEERKETYERAMLNYRVCLEMCGLTLNEIIALGNAENIDNAVDTLFSHSQTYVKHG